MDNKQIREIILNDIKEINSICSDFGKYDIVPPILQELALAKVKNLIAEIQLLNKDNNELAHMGSLNDIVKAELQGKKNESSVIKEAKKTEKEIDAPVPAGFSDEDHITNQLSGTEHKKRKREQALLAAQLSHDPIEDINTAISLNEKIWFIKELFNGSIDLYNQTLQIVSKSTNLDEALDYLEEKFNWPETNKTVEDFFTYVYLLFA